MRQSALKFANQICRHLTAGRQDYVPAKPLTYGQSITDACIGWDDSVRVLEILAEGVRQRRLKATGYTGK